jgi:hypothetical protein
MSYGTILYPKVEDFPKYADFTCEELQSSIDSEIRFMTNKFNNFRGLAFCTPYDIFGKDSYSRVVNLVTDSFNDYVESFRINFMLNNLLDLKDQAKRIKEGDTYDDGTPKRPYLYFNHFVYHSREEALSLIEENTNELLKLKGRIIGLCLATPIDITPRDDTRYSDGHYEPISYLENELNYLEESLDDCLRAICVAEITEKYWDGHEEG